MLTGQCENENISAASSPTRLPPSSRASRYTSGIAAMPTSPVPSFSVSKVGGRPRTSMSQFVT